MGERTEHAPGTFSWTDLNTTDQEAAKAFYSGLFGWEIEGKGGGAIAPQPQQQRDAGVPPAWNSYITVADADATAAKAAELGATVHAPPFDVMEAGRMAVIQDPQGGWFLIWQPKQHLGAQLVNAPGALCWNELGSPDLDASAAFYGGLFGLTTSPMEGGGKPYPVIGNE